MGFVKSVDAPAAGTPEESPIVKTLKEIDDRYLAIDREYAAAEAALVAKYTELQRPLLAARAARLAAGEAASTGTPALKGFWLQCLKNHPELSESIQEWDEPVLEYLTDITANLRDVTDSNKGFRLVFKFAENPYFENAEVTKEYESEEASPYNGEMAAKGIRCTPIDWKAGKDVTVERVAKKVKGGGAKKAKQKGKETEQPRQSFFREFFRDLYPGCMTMQDGEFEQLCMEEMIDPSDPQLLEHLMTLDHERGDAIKDYIVPFAVRWYTGEAVPEGAYDDDEDEEEEDDEDDEEETDSEDDSPAPPKQNKNGNKPQGKSGEAPAKPQEECKQQ